jgi:hypothetical protein
MGGLWDPANSRNGFAPSCQSAPSSAISSKGSGNRRFVAKQYIHSSDAAFIADPFPDFGSILVLGLSVIMRHRRANDDEHGADVGVLELDGAFRSRDALLL